MEGGEITILENVYTLKDWKYTLQITDCIALKTCKWVIMWISSLLIIES